MLYNKSIVCKQSAQPGVHLAVQPGVGKARGREGGLPQLAGSLASSCERHYQCINFLHWASSILKNTRVDIGLKMKCLYSISYCGFVKILFNTVQNINTVQNKQHQIQCNQMEIHKYCHYLALLLMLKVLSALLHMILMPMGSEKCYK